MKIKDGVYMLELTTNTMGKAETIYPTLILNGDSLVLIDTGFPGLANQIYEQIEKEDLSFNKLDTIIFTHQDIDHVGSVYDILEKVEGNIKTFSHEAEKAYITGEKTPIKLAKFQRNLANLPEQMKVVCNMLKAGFEKNRVAINETLTDGQELPYCGGITVIHTPGHTPGHICLYVKQYKLLIAGDTLCISEGKLCKQNEKSNDDSELNMKSIEKLMGYDIETVICYHGGIYRDNVNKCIAEIAGRL